MIKWPTAGDEMDGPAEAEAARWDKNQKEHGIAPSHKTATWEHFFSTLSHIG